jgi:N6-L-threonylcarbamoyladenine synthase
MKVIGEKIDYDACEAFYKADKIMGITYPGGPLIDKYAKSGNRKAFSFTKPVIPGLDFSFSGLKTGFMNFINTNMSRDPFFIEKNCSDICASFQSTIIDTLLIKLKKAVIQTGVKQVAIAGGVSANSGLREALEKMRQEFNWKLFIPKFEYCTDNAAMIAITGYYKYLREDFAVQEITPMPRYSL